MSGHEIPGTVCSVANILPAAYEEQETRQQSAGAESLNKPARLTARLGFTILLRDKESVLNLVCKHISARETAQHPAQRRAES